MNAGRQLLLVFACIGCLLVVATALPSADPRIDSPGGVGWGPVVDSESSTAGESEPIDGSDEDENISRELSPSAGVDVQGYLAPTRTVRISATRGSDPDTLSTRIVVDGETLTADGSADYTVPFTEHITVALPEENVTETFQVDTDADIVATDALVPGREVNLTATVGSQPLPAAAVRMQGELVTATDEAGVATVTLPAEDEEVRLTVERDVVRGQTTVTTADVNVSFASPLVLPGLPATVQVTADGDPVEGATVEVDGDTARTGENGEASLWMPVNNEVEVSTTVGAARAGTGASGLYLRLTAIVLGVPSVVIGLVVTYLRLTSRSARRRHETVFFRVGSGLLGLFRLPSLPSVPGFGTGSRPGSLLPSLSFSLPSLPQSRPSLPNLPGGFSVLGAVGNLVSGGDSTAGQGTSAEPGIEGETAGGESTGETTRTPEEQVGRRFHRFVAHLGIERPETWTPGQVARRALAAGYPGGQVRTLVETFRAVEYGGRDATRDRVERIRETTRSLLEASEEEES